MEDNNKKVQSVIDNSGLGCIDCEEPVVEINNRYVSEQNNITVDGAILVPSRAEDIFNKA